MDHKRMKIVLECFDKLPLELRDWISNLHFSLHDDHILRGKEEILRVKRIIECGGPVTYRKGNDQN